MWIYLADKHQDGVWHLLLNGETVAGFSSLTADERHVQAAVAGLNAYELLHAVNQEDTP